MNKSFVRNIDFLCILTLNMRMRDFIGGLRGENEYLFDRMIRLVLVDDDVSECMT